MPKATSDAKPADDRLKRKGAGVGAKKGKKAGTKKRKKAAKHPKKPESPSNAYIIFMEDFIKKNPNRSVSLAAVKHGAKAWKDMPAAEKAHYNAKAEELEEGYKKDLHDFSNSLALLENPFKEEGSDKSKSEVNDEDDGDDDEDDE